MMVFRLRVWLNIGNFHHHKTAALLCGLLCTLATPLLAQAAPRVQQVSGTNYSQASFGSSAMIQPPNATSYLESRVASLESQLQSLQSEQADDFSPSGYTPRRIGFYAGGAAVWAKPHFKEAFQ